MFSRLLTPKWLLLHLLVAVLFVATFFLGYWQLTELGSMTAPYRERPPLAHDGSVERAVAAARAAAPDSDLRFIAFPGNPFASPHHFVAFMHGSTPLTSRLLTPILIDAETSAVVDQRALPWYTTALLVSQPLHFGDYGGMPLKVLWALLDLVAIVVLGSGVYLWVAKWRVPIETRVAALSAEAAE